MSDWWWSRTRGTTLCGECQVRIGEGTKVAYNYAEGRVRCERCIAEMGTEPKLGKSLRRKAAVSKEQQLLSF